MKVLNAEQLRAWDEYTIRNEPIAPIDLMERASRACVTWLQKNDFLPATIAVFCGKGNNGGDGLAIARLLSATGSKVFVYILEFGNKGTEEFQENLKRLHTIERLEIHYIQNEEQFPIIPCDLIVDALVGSGLSRPLTDLSASLVKHINSSGIPVISIDLPSGLPVDRTSVENSAVRANHTLTFQCYKPALLVEENSRYTGDVHVLDIGLHPKYLFEVSGYAETIDLKLISGIYRPREKYAHKGKYGHSLLVCGSYGKIGAAVLCAKGCLRSGSGLVSVVIPKCGYEILQGSVPEAMVFTDPNNSFISTAEFFNSDHDAIGVGPGLGTATETRAVFKDLFQKIHKPIVIDADALNILSIEKNLLNSIPSNSILTPHPKEFERMFGQTSNDFTRMDLAIEKARTLNVIIILKGHHTFVATPGGQSYFNTTGNAGMATAGSGDVLTGILTSLIGQGYDPINAALMGVFIHGLAGDLAASARSQESMIAGDIIEHLGEAFQLIGNN